MVDGFELGAAAANGGAADGGYEAMDTIPPPHTQSSAINTKNYKPNAMPINQRPKHVL